MALEDRTHDELDELATENGVEDYPASANKPEKIAALEAAGIEDTTPTERDVDSYDAGYVRVRPGTTSPTLAAARDRERERVAAIDEAARERRRNAEPAPVSTAMREQAEATRRRELEGLADPIVGTNPDEDADADDGEEPDA